MLHQQIMIDKVRETCIRDERLVSALMYGSFATGEGDEFSDIEFYLFFEDEVLTEVDEEEWVSRIAPVELYYVNEFGNGTVIFENLVRGEFHFENASGRDVPDLDTPERALFLCRSLINWTLMGANLLKRGEHARAEAFLTLVHGHLLQAMRLIEGKTAN